MTTTAWRHEDDPMNEPPIIHPDKTSSAFGCAFCIYGLIICAIVILICAVWGTK